MAVIKIKWTVEELDNVMSQFDTQKVYRATAQGGPYSEITGPGTRVDLVAGQTAYYYDDTAGDESYWYKISYFNSTSLLESELSDPIPATGGGKYVTVQDMRDEGVSATEYDDARLVKIIKLAEAFVERVTGRWFYARHLTIKVDGTDSPWLRVPAPIVTIEEAKLLYEPVTGTPAYTDLTLDDLRIYNRHLTQGLLDPDDRDAPRIVMDDYDYTTIARWPRGAQNVILTGFFGYTELGPNDPVGETSDGSQVPLSYGAAPPLICDAVKRLVVMWLPQRTDTEALDEAASRHRITRIKTRDQEIQYASPATAAGARVGWASGDPNVDSILAMYKRPVNVGMA